MKKETKIKDVKIMKLKGFKGSGKMLITIPKQIYKKLPDYYFIELDFDKLNIEKREKQKR